MFSNKSKTANAEWKIKIHKQNKKHITNFIIKFEALVIKTETNEIYIIFLLKKNIKTDIIKIILGYPPMVVSKTLREWKVEKTLVR